MLTDEETRLLAMISGERAGDHVAKLINPAERVAGSQAEQIGAQVVQKLFQPFVDLCEIEEVPVWTYRRGEASVRIVAPVTRTIGPAYVSPVSGDGAGTGALVDIGYGMRQDYELLRCSVEGRVALVTISGPEAVMHRSGSINVPGSLARVANEAKHRGVACLLYHIEHRPHPSILVSNVDLPTIAIGSDQAAELRNAMRSGDTVVVDYRSEVEETESTSLNVVATVTGSTWPEEVVYATSHYDTWFTGANDNNSTTAVLLELAAILKAQRPQRTVRFVIFGAEESGARIGESDMPFFIGSVGYSEQNRRLIDPGGGSYAVAVINGEILGHSPDAVLRVTPDLEVLASNVIDDLGVNRQVGRPVQGGWVVSDHVSFHTLGVPSIYVHPRWPGTEDGYWPLYHTPMDDLELINPVAIEANARAFVLLALRLANCEELPLSLDDLVQTAHTGLSETKRSGEIASLLQERLSEIQSASSAEFRRRRALQLAGTVHRNIYCFSGWSREFTLKFGSLSDASGILRQAHYLLTVEGDRDRAKSMLLRLADSRVANAFSDWVIDDADKRRSNTPLLARLDTPIVDTRVVLELLRLGAECDEIASAVRALINDLAAEIDRFALRFEQELRTVFV